LIDLYRALFAQSISLQTQVQMTPNLVCMFMAITRNAVHKNHNPTLFRVCVIPVWFLQSISCQKRNFVNIGSNDSKPGMHVFAGTRRAVHKNRNFTLFRVFYYFPFDLLYRAFLSFFQFIRLWFKCISCQGHNLLCMIFGKRHIA